MKKLLFFLLLLSPMLYGQESITISGIVVNEKSQPLPYANIGIRKYSLGTVSNNSGEFEFVVPTRLAGDTVVISFIGYQSWQSSVADFKNGKIVLREAPLMLKEVVVSSDQARAMVKKALDNCRNVQARSPLLMEGFHRSWEKVVFADGSDCPGTLIEAAVTVYDPATKTGKSEIYLNEIKRTSLREGWQYGSGSALQDLLHRDLTRNPMVESFPRVNSFFSFEPSMNYEFEGVSTIDGEELSVVVVEVITEKKQKFKYRIFISERDHAVMQFELRGGAEHPDFLNGPWNTNDLSVTYSFRRFEGRPYLKYVRKEYIITLLDVKNKKAIRTETYFREFMINQLITDDVANKRQRLSALKAKNVSIAVEDRGFNPEFWKSYNTIKENPTDVEVVRYFEGHDGAPCKNGVHQK